MKALTTWQPWGSILIERLKPFEFRGWAPPPDSPLIGQRMVLHAAKRPVTDNELQQVMRYVLSDHARVDGVDFKAFDLLDREWTQRIMSPARSVHARAAKRDSALPLGAGLGTFTLGAPRRVEQRAGTTAQYAWPILDVEKWPEPVAMKGGRGFWDWPS